jgi:hypothetical protein
MFFNEIITRLLYFGPGPWQLPAQRAEHEPPQEDEHEPPQAPPHPLEQLPPQPPEQLPLHPVEQLPTHEPTQVEVHDPEQLLHELEQPEEQFQAQPLPQRTWSGLSPPKRSCALLTLLWICGVTVPGVATVASTCVTRVRISLSDIIKASL